MVSKLLAPAMPFLAEELHQNLVRSFDERAPESVHLADWPAYDGTVIDEKLNHEMALTMKLASLGHAARNKANRKVRQPLAEVAFAVGGAEDQPVVERYGDLLADELNVKKVRVLSAASEAVAYSLNPLPKQLGQKYGARYPGIRKALLVAPAEEAARKLMNGESITITADGVEVAILPEEVEVRIQAKEGFSVASDGAYLAALVTELTPELVAEGLGREFVRRVQDLRKTADFDIADRIRVYYEASPKLAEAVAAYRDYIQAETLAVELLAGSPGGPLPGMSDTFDGESVTVAVEKVFV
jgi:isoleucyl-tRNA synthetase